MRLEGTGRSYSKETARQKKYSELHENCLLNTCSRYFSKTGSTEQITPPEGDSWTVKEPLKFQQKTQKP